MSKEHQLYGWDSSMEMTLHDKIRQDMKTAMVNKDIAVRDTMRLIIGQFPSLTVNITLESGKKTTRVKTPEEITVDLSEFKSPMQAMGVVMKHFGKLADGNQVGFKKTGFFIRIAMVTFSVRQCVENIESGFYRYFSILQMPDSRQD